MSACISTSMLEPRTLRGTFLPALVRAKRVASQRSFKTGLLSVTGPLTKRSRRKVWSTM